MKPYHLSLELLEPRVLPSKPVMPPIKPMEPAPPTEEQPPPTPAAPAEAGPVPVEDLPESLQETAYDILEQRAHEFRNEQNKKALEDAKKFIAKVTDPPEHHREAHTHGAELLEDEDPERPRKHGIRVHYHQHHHEPELPLICVVGPWHEPEQQPAKKEQ